MKKNKITCNVLVAGTNAAEYKESSNGSTCECYIIAEEEKNFTLNIDLSLSDAERHDTALSIDGQNVDSWTTTEKSLPITYVRIAEPNGRIDLSKLKFAKLKSVEESGNGIESKAEILGNLGTIRIQIWRALPQAVGTMPYAFGPGLSQNPIHEKDLKGREITHRVELTDRIPSVPSYAIPTLKIDPWDSPFITFLFRYGSKGSFFHTIPTSLWIR
ncbi:hypothetical protein ABW19_dt0203317 [Dactylella cylindrospora]|nr:hypothetical protein ABW19_dt0203317 [Dactylella cylindrospora]